MKPYSIYTFLCYLYSSWIMEDHGWILKLLRQRTLEQSATWPTVHSSWRLEHVDLETGNICFYLTWLFDIWVDVRTHLSPAFVIPGVLGNTFIPQPAQLWWYVVCLERLAWRSRDVTITTLMLVWNTVRRSCRSLFSSSTTTSCQSSGVLARWCNSR